MRGHTAKKGNRYYAVIYEGVDPATGKERHRWYAAGTRKSDADKLVTELVKRRHDGDDRSPEKITLGAYLTDKWLPAQRGQLRPSTLDSYERNVRLHVLPKLGRIGLHQLAPEDLDRFYGELLTGGRRDGRGGLSHKTVRYIHGILHKALADAHRKGTVLRNVAALADPPKLSSSKKREMRVWTASELREFLAGVAVTVSTPRSSWRRIRGCAAVRCSGCVGPTSTSTAPACRSIRRSSRSPTASRSQT